MKKMKANVARSDEMGEVEISLGRLATQKAKGATAQYLGHMVVRKKDARPSSGLSEGLWLVRTCSIEAKTRPGGHANGAKGKPNGISTIMCPASLATSPASRSSWLSNKESCPTTGVELSRLQDS